MAVTLDDALAQIVQLGDAVGQLRVQITNLTSDNLELRQQVREGRGGAAGTANGQQKSELRSLKASYPEQFNPKNDSFKTWADDFENWMKTESPAAHAYLKAAVASKTPVSMPTDGSEVDLSCCYVHLRKLMGDRESKTIVRNTSFQNAPEAYRLLTKRYHPRTAAQKSAAVRG